MVWEQQVRGTRLDKNYSREKEFIEDLGQFADLDQDLDILVKDSSSESSENDNGVMRLV